ncbi:SDR family NAD(P)-dependent oxidoreductase [Paraburkholderia diazotrophica]|uniref:SDR family NAD(P)-dependent oxidoreductase n=1 Tax=Paraburkholderia diazotrophica TaxID=667676 RepID=UPI00317F78E8
MTSRERVAGFRSATVMVTGAAGGLGRAVAPGLASHGVPTVCVDAKRDGLAETQAEARCLGAS